MVCQNCGSAHISADGVCADCGWSAETAGSRYGTKPMQTANTVDSGATREASVLPRTSRPTGGPLGTLSAGNPGQGLLSRSAASAISAPSTPSSPPIETPPLADDQLEEVPAEDEIEDFCGNCGAPIQHGRTFCGQCGAPVSRGGASQATASTRQATYPRMPTWLPEDREAPTQADIQSPSGGSSVPLTALTPQQRALRIGLGILCLLGSLVTAVMAITQLVR